MQDSGELVANVAMDLSNAFDVIQHDLLLAKLNAYRVKKKELCIAKDYFFGRQQRVKIGDTVSAWSDVKRYGAPFVKKFSTKPNVFLVRFSCILPCHTLFFCY